MKQIERFDLIDRVARELQARMTYTDIDVYLAGFGVAPQEGAFNSKWVYAKACLAPASSDVLIRIADELELPHNHVVVPGTEVAQSRFWEAGHFRLFLSHLSTFKGKTAALQSGLKSYGISSFVAHKDIEPTREWQEEIEAALFSMDALAAILMPGFKESNWTDQEVGVAIGRGVPVIPIIRGLNPYGFIGKYQGFVVGERSVKQVARSVFDILASHDRTHSKAWAAFIDTLLLSTDTETLTEKVSILASADDPPAGQLEKLREGASANTVIAASGLKPKINDVLQRHGVDPIPEKVESKSPWDPDGDLPF